MLLAEWLAWLECRDLFCVTLRRLRSVTEGWRYPAVCFMLFVGHVSQEKEKRKKLFSSGTIKKELSIPDPVQAEVALTLYI